MRSLLLSFLTASVLAANLSVDNATPVRFGASFATADGVRVANFNGANGVDIPISVEDPSETEVIAWFRAEKGRKLSLRANIGRRVVAASAVGTGEPQQLSLGKMQVPAGLSRISVNAPESGGARVRLFGLVLPGVRALSSPAILPLNTTYVDAGKGGPTSWKSLDLSVDGEARIPLFGEQGPQERVLAIRLRSAGPGKLVIKGEQGPAVTLDLAAGPATLKTPAIKFQAGIQLLRLRATGTSVRIDEITLESGSVSQLWSLPNGNAQSVHFGYPVPREVRARWAYAEALAEPGPPTTYHCVLGFGQGYFGYQVRGAGTRPDDRWFIYSMWDNGYVRNHEKQAAGEDLKDKVVTLVSKGEGVVAHAFDHEGSGGHSHLDFQWKDREPYKFLLGVKPDGKAAVFSAYVDGPGLNGWRFLASFRRPNTQARLDGLYSFVEDWSGRWGDQQRACRYRNFWVCGDDGKWVPLTQANTSATAELGRTDYSHNLVDGMFELRTGGYDRTDGREGATLTVPSWGEAPKVDFTALPTK
jgi:hypothetical protein